MDVDSEAFQDWLGFGIIFGWPSQRSDCGDCGMHTRFPGFVRSPWYAACSVTRKRASSHPQSAVKKTICGGCGRGHSGWYDRRTRRVRDLSCGDARIFLDIEM